MNTPQDRRNFLKSAAIGIGALASAQNLFGDIIASVEEQKKLWGSTDLVTNERFWIPIQRAFKLSPEFINLEHGYFSMMPTRTLEALQKRTSSINTEASYYMRTKRLPMLENTREALARFAGCGTDEIAITRNTTESMNIVIQGIELAAGDEVIIGDQDYGSMVEALKYRAGRDGIHLKTVEVPLDPTSDDEVVNAYTAAITDKTRLIHLTHLINITGHVLPVAKVADKAHAKGIAVLVDSAHAFAHIDFKVTDLRCDYMGTSLHKWLCAPLGLGALYVKKEQIKGVSPLIGRIREPDDIRKLDTLGTQPYAAHETIPDAISFHESIGSVLKQERLRYLRNRWINQVKNHPQVLIHSPSTQERSSAIGNVGIRGLEPAEFARILMDEYKIYTVPIGHPRVPGLRITPHLCTRIEEIDTFAAAVLEIAERVA